MSTLLAVTLLVALISYDVAKTHLFRPLRVWLARRTPRRLRQLWRCHYCLSHHVAWVMLLLLGWYYPFGTRLDPVLTWAAVVMLAAPVMTALDWAIDATDSFKRVFRIPERAESPEDGAWNPGRWAGDRIERLQ